jgi:hypothetical protein
MCSRDGRVWVSSLSKAYLLQGTAFAILVRSNVWHGDGRGYGAGDPREFYCRDRLAV